MDAQQPPQRFVGLVNPVAGRRDSFDRWDRLALRLIESGCDVDTVVTEGSPHAVASAAVAAGEGAVVVAIGGDGLVRDVAAGVVRSGGTMAIVPSGRGNDLAAKLGIPSRSEWIGDMLVAGHTQVIDVLDVNGHVVPGNVYAGVDSVAARIINRNRRIPALALYRGAGVAAVAGWRSTDFLLHYSTPSGYEERRVRAHDIVIANSGRYGNGLNIVPDAKLDDGLIDVLIVEYGSPLRIGSVMRAVRTGAHVDREDVDVFQTTEVTIAASRPVPFGADGDEVTDLPAAIKMRPKALRVIVPATADYEPK